jgi:uncharacterized membrane protein
MYIDPSGNFPLALLFAPPLIEAFGAVLVAAAPYIAAIVIVVLVAVLIYEAYELTNTLIDVQAAKKSRESQKEKSSDKPSWVHKGMEDQSLSAQDNATKMLNEKYGIGQWNKPPRKSEYGQIIKWLIRSNVLKQVINSLSEENEYGGYDFVYDKSWR